MGGHIRDSPALQQLPQLSEQTSGGFLYGPLPRNLPRSFDVKGTFLKHAVYITKCFCGPSADKLLLDSFRGGIWAHDLL